METLPYTAEIAAAAAPFYARVRHVVPEIEWPVFAPYVLLPRRRVLDPSQADWVLSYAGDLGALQLRYARVVDLGNGMEIAQVQR